MQIHRERCRSWAGSGVRAPRRRDAPGLARARELRSDAGQVGEVHRLRFLERSKQLLCAVRIVPVPTELFENPALPFEVTLSVRGPSFSIGEMSQNHVSVHAED